MKKNNKGFTLIELIAVIVIVIVLLLIAFNKSKNSTQKAKLDSIKASAINYVKTVKNLLGEDVVDTESLDEGFFTLAELEEYDLKISGTKPDAGYFIVDNYNISSYCLIYGDYYTTDVEAENPFKEGKCETSILAGDYSYTGNQQKFVAPHSGTYKIELWGASGGSGSLIAGGAYTSGEIELQQGEELYFYIGQKTNGASAAYNGGAACSGNCVGGGGATDVRLLFGPWNDAQGLKSRIMVAAGGAGYETYQSGYRGGAGGALTGFSGEGDTPKTGGSQTAGGGGATESRRGSFGVGGTGDNWGGGGSGGYYGGSGGYNSSTGNGGSSGSSYISGHLGCVAVTSQFDLTPRKDSTEVNQCEDETTDIVCSYHYSGKIFTNTQMIAGNAKMPSYNAGTFATGNTDNGHAKIYLIG